MPLKLIDLFAGAGGLTLGFTDERFGGGFKCIFGVDNDQAAVDTHNNHFGNHSLCVDIEEWLAGKPAIPKADIVVGGPPCQGFSLLNKKRNGDARRALWEPFMDVVQQSEARAFVIENVQGLLKSPEFIAISKRAKKLGFEIRAAVLNAADYGAPQTRKRAIIMGWKPNESADEICFPPQPTHAKDGKEGLLPWRTVADMISDLPPPVGTELRACPPPLDLHFGRNPTPVSLKRYKAVPRGGNRFDLQKNAPHITPKCWIRKKSGGTDLFGRLWWDRPSVTIRTEFFKPEKGRYLHPEQHRPITHREAARLMGFPDDFVFLGTKTRIARQIGNAVPPPLAGSIAKLITGYLTRRRKRAA
ncbi:MAG: DNA cytosine methyltransferase [Gammaproteobacteria bacterium]|nr:DNA cytosine methyltransferase [Gammaproteobacteria bacterium]MDH5650708.1 DNA cytosine methyltransferase [Gammaproteobacteria bacterium]